MCLDRKIYIYKLNICSSLNLWNAKERRDYMEIYKRRENMDEDSILQVSINITNSNIITYNNDLKDPIL